jgi:hypothetical protein
MKRLKYALAALLVGAGYAPLGHATVFSVDRTIGTGTVVGTITTDGTLGVLGTADVTTWDLTLSAGAASFTLLGPLSGNNSALTVVGSDLSATATQLVFDFSSYGLALFQNPGIGSSQNWYCIEGPSSNCTPFGTSSTGTESVQVGLYPNSTYGVAHYDSSQVIGTTGVPEPSTWALIVAGFAGIGLVARARSKKIVAAAA